MISDGTLVDGVSLTAGVTDEEESTRSDLVFRARRVSGEAEAAIALARLIGTRAPTPGGGETARRWEMLATVAAIDLTAARVAEAHLDALAILAEAGIDPGRDLAALGVTADSTWGVFAAESPGVRVDAEPVQLHGAGRWQLAGIKPWCSLAGSLSHALVTAHTGAGRRLFAIPLRDERVTVLDQPWVSRGLRAVPSGPIELRGVVALPIGADNWYLDRSGFGWGGAGVAACWYGGSVGLARKMLTRIRSREAGPIERMQLGAVDLRLHAARVALLTAAQDIDAGRADDATGARLAARVRGVVAQAAEEVITRVGHLLGPAPFTQDEDFAAQMADLQIYLRQHHAERDEAALGADLLTTAGSPW